jgi:hypothetical protein
MKPGDRFGRWTVIRASSPAKESANDEGLRSCVLTRCVCGHEKVSSCRTLQRGKSTGCKSKTCAARWAASNELKARLDTWLDGWIREARERDDDSDAAE